MSDNANKAALRAAADNASKDALNRARDVAIAKGKLTGARGRSVFANIAQLLLSNPSAPSLGLPAGMSVQTNSSRVARFPIPLTVGGVSSLGVGGLMMMRGHRVIGAFGVLVGVLALSAAAAAPELNAALAKSRNP